MKRYLLVSCMLCAIASADAPITTESLLNEMVDFERLTRLPVPAYVTKQFSSYDRKSKSPEEEWFANGDRGQYLRVEKNGDQDEYVMMDAEGPGTVVRIWSANPDGIIRIYIDGAESPTLEAPMKSLLAGEVEGFPKPLAGERSKGFNLYFPIPYAKSCKITSDRKNLYYHVNYRTYQAGTKVTSFELTDLKRLGQQIQRTAQHLTEPKATSESSFSFAAQVAGQNQIPLFEERAEQQVITQLTIAIQAKDLVAATRGLVLNVFFDGEQAIETPIGDFFGTAPGPTAYSSFPFKVVKPAENVCQMTCRWWMPFQKEVKAFITNPALMKDVKIAGLVARRNYQWDGQSLLFHAKWRIERDIPVRPPMDWTHLDCKGAGRFVGSALYLFNPVERWWGEGDEKIYVDGEKFPSHFGTGSEDYYGYAWCSADPFTSPYHNQPRVDGPGNQGHTANNRFHILDDIPFTKSFRFDMENLHHHGYKNLPQIQVTRAAVSYWYARPGGSDAFKPILANHVRLDTPQSKPATQPTG